MSSKKTKLELTWIGKEHRPKLEPRILLEEPDKSHHAKFRVNEPQVLTTKSTKNTKDQKTDSFISTTKSTENTKGQKMDSSMCSLCSLWPNHPGDIFDNMLIRGDNLLGLKALEQEFAGKVKCVFIDPPYNTVILEREAIKWFKPAKGQIYYKNGADHPEYQPDFVVETKTAIYILEPKSKKDLEEPIVVAKKDAAERWCERASNHNSKHGGKLGEYALISHDKIAQNMTIEGLVALKVQ